MKIRPKWNLQMYNFLNDLQISSRRSLISITKGVVYYRGNTLREILVPQPFQSIFIHVLEFHSFEVSLAQSIVWSLTKGFYSPNVFHLLNMAMIALFVYRLSRSRQGHHGDVTVFILKITEFIEKGSKLKVSVNKHVPHCVETCHWVIIKYSFFHSIGDIQNKFWFVT